MAQSDFVWCNRLSSWITPELDCEAFSQSHGRHLDSDEHQHTVLDPHGQMWKPEIMGVEAELRALIAKQEADRDAALSQGHDPAAMHHEWDYDLSSVNLGHSYDQGHDSVKVGYGYGTGHDSVKMGYGYGQGHDSVKVNYGHGQGHDSVTIGHGYGQGHDSVMTGCENPYDQQADLSYQPYASPPTTKRSSDWEYEPSAQPSLPRRTWHKVTNLVKPPRK